MRLNPCKKCSGRKQNVFSMNIWPYTFCLLFTTHFCTQQTYILCLFLYLSEMCYSECARLQSIGESVWSVPTCESRQSLSYAKTSGYHNLAHISLARYPMMFSSSLFLDCSYCYLFRVLFLYSQPILMFFSISLIFLFL